MSRLYKVYMSNCRVSVSKVRLEATRKQLYSLRSAFIVQLISPLRIVNAAKHLYYGIKKKPQNAGMLNMASNFVFLSSEPSEFTSTHAKNVQKECSKSALD